MTLDPESGARQGGSLSRREFLEIVGALAVCAPALNTRALARASDSALVGAVYDVPPSGNVSLLHFTDCHAQLLPLYYREPQVNIGTGPRADKPPHLVGTRFLRYYGLHPGSREAHAFTYLDFEAAARRFGRV